MKGAYTEDVVELLRKREGWELVGDAAHVNAPGYDRIVRRGDIVRLIEAKAREALRLEDVKNLIRFDEVAEEIRFADDYFDRWGGGAREAFEQGQLEVELFLNGPNSSAIQRSLLRELGLPEGTTSFLAHYEDTLGNPRTAEVILRAVSR